MRYASTALLAVTLALAAEASFAQEETYRPFVLASSGHSTLEDATQDTLERLESAGFSVAGQYSPVNGTNVIVVTSEELQAVATETGRGAYAAAQRIAASQTEAGVEVGFVNPLYIQHAYRLEGDLQAVYDSLTAALGFEAYCGAGNKKMTAAKLRKYNYMMGMQKFDDPSELGSFESHEAAVAAVEAGLAREGDGLTKVYRIDLPGGDQTLFGVGMKATGEEDKNIDEDYQLQIVDFEGCRKRAYLPYEILVSGGSVEALHMRFRMAVHFPNLSMMGKHGFTKLMPFPGAIEDALKSLVNE